MFLIPMVRGLVLALVGLGAGAGIATAIGAATGAADTLEPALALGYVFALAGWLLGVGLWETLACEWFGLPRRPHEPTGWQRYFAFSTDHKVIGLQYIVTFLVLFLIAGLLAMLIRLEHVGAAAGTIMAANTYNYVMSLHGIAMVAVAVAVLTGGMGNYFVPLLIGAEDVAFPRINALSFWVIPPVVVLLLAAPLLGGYDSGWTAYPPLSEVNATGQLLFLMGFATFGLSSILGALNFITTVAKLRAPGMTWGRIPIFVWGGFTASFISLTATQFVFIALVLVVFDRVFHMTFYQPKGGGAPLLYQHLFWFYSHPAVYIMALPGFGLALEVLTHFSRKPLFAYKWVVGAFIGIVSLSFIVWAHHQYTSGMPGWLHIPFMVTTELISIPTGIIFLSALGTIWLGRLWLTTPMLFALGFVFNFLIGGITGIFLADVPTDIHLQDTYFVVAHFHYTIMGGEIFALFAGIYYWFPKITGRMFNQKLGNVHFWAMFIFYNLTYLAMFYVGFQGQNRRVATYPPQLQLANEVTSVFSFLLGLSFLLWVYNMVHSWLRGPKAAANPWMARTLEWQTSSPPPAENFLHPPVVLHHPYDYGVPGAVHARTDGGEALAVGG